jgi:serine/threonine-protein kinase HipA
VFYLFSNLINVLVVKNYKNKNPEYALLSDNVDMVQEPAFTYGSSANRCLYCYEPLTMVDDSFYHNACCKKFFGQAYTPVFNYDANALENVALQYLNVNMGVTGVQPKLSLSWYKKQEKNAVKKLTIVGLYGDYILKPQSKFYPSLPEVEDCTMKMAAVCGLKTVPHTLFPLQDGSLCYLTKRVDRSRHRKYHMEDMCQLTERLTEDKYKGSHEQVAKTVLKFSATGFLDVTNFYEYVMFSYLTGNADMHLKNFSLLETEEAGKYMLSPAYDMLSTALVNPSDKEELALTLNAKKSNLKYNDFLQAFLTSGLTQKQLNKTTENFYYCQLEMQAVVGNSFLSAEMKLQFLTLLKSRLKRLVDDRG